MNHVTINGTIHRPLVAGWSIYPGPWIVTGLALSEAEMDSCHAEAVTLHSCWNQFGSVSCVPSRFTRLWKWMFSMRVADFCMHLFTHLNLSYMLLGEWKAIISSFWSRNGRGTMISTLQFCAKTVNHFPSYCLRKTVMIQPYFLLDLQMILTLMGVQCLRT